MEWLRCKLRLKNGSTGFTPLALSISTSTCQWICTKNAVALMCSTRSIWRSSKRAIPVCSVSRFISKTVTCRKWLCAWRSIKWRESTLSRMRPAASLFAKTMRRLAGRGRPAKSGSSYDGRGRAPRRRLGFAPRFFTNSECAQSDLPTRGAMPPATAESLRPSGSPRDGLTAFGREVVRECEALGVIVDLAHINPRALKRLSKLTTRAVIVSHTNARKFYDIERNISDEQIKMIGERRGVIGVNAMLVSSASRRSDDSIVMSITSSTSRTDWHRWRRHWLRFSASSSIEQWPESMRKELAAKFTTPHFIPDLTNHSHARNLTRKLIERGFNDERHRENLARKLDADS